MEILKEKKTETQIELKDEPDKKTLEDVYLRKTRGLLTLKS